MKLAVHQPNFIPWLGYFKKIQEADIFVLLDDVQYIRRGFINRNKIKTPQKEQWLTLPVVTRGNYLSKINEIKVFNKNLTLDRLLNSIKFNYSRSKYFDKYFESISDIIKTGDVSMADINMNLIFWLCNILDIKTKILRSSELDLKHSNATERIISICQYFDSNQYISGSSGYKYQNLDLFKANSIEVITLNFEIQEYPQLWGEFVGGLSVLDSLFNCDTGVKSLIN